MVGKQRLWGIVFIVVGVLLLVYLGTRLTNLTSLPIFTDEAIYIRWSQIGSRDANWRFISLVDGKQPLFTWLMMALLRIVPDPLLAGRLVSVLAGVGGFFGMAALSYALFGNVFGAVFAMAVYVLSPFALMYDRLALYDSLVGCLYIWNLFIAILLVRTLRLDVALIFGMTLGVGMLNKTSAFLSLYLAPATALLFDWTSKKRTKRFLLWAGLLIVSAVLSQAVYSVLRLSPLFHMIGRKDLVFIYSFSEWTEHPFRFLVGNLRGLFDWLIGYMTWPMFLMSFVPLLFFRRFLREKLLLYFFWLAPFFGLALFARVLYPRFIFPMTLPLLLLSAHGIAVIGEKFKLRIFGVLFAAFLLLPSIYADYFIIVRPTKAPIPLSDKNQLISDWPSGWGTKEVVEILREEATKQKLTVYTEGTFGLLPYALEIYLVDNPQITIKGIWPVPAKIPQEIVNTAKKEPTYMIFNENQSPPPWPMELISEYVKGEQNERKLRLYKIAP